MSAPYSHTMRVKATLAYDGSRYYGSQKLLHSKKESYPTIQLEIEKCLHAYNISSPTIFSGRTDKNVHATRQVISFDLPPFWKDLEKLKKAINRQLSSIKIRYMEFVNNDFHPRYQAKRRTYRYIISTKANNPFQTNYITFLDSFNVERAKKTIKYFEGEHDFEYFRKSGSDETSTIRKIFKTEIYQHKEYIILKFVGNGFLRSQIRMMVGAIIAENSGLLSTLQIKEQLYKKAKHFNKPAEAAGLYLAHIAY